MARPKGSADLLEDRRWRALTLLDTGLSLNEVARRMRSSASSVLRWRNARRRGGAEALRVRFSPGRPLKLGKTQRRQLVKLLLKGPLAHGYRTNLWTTARIAELMRRTFGVRYHRDHVGGVPNLLARLPVATFLDYGPSVDAGGKCISSANDFRKPRFAVWIGYDF